MGGLFLLLACFAGSHQAVAQDARPAERKYALRTLSGYYLTAENGGGSVVNTDRKELGPWEMFTLVPVSPGVFAFRTETGHYLSDSVLKMRRGGGNRQRQQQEQQSARGGLIANQNTGPDASSQFKLLIVNPEGPVVALVTSAGKYVTAENGGGMKARSSRAMASDRSEIGDWELFVLVDVQKPH